MKLADFTTGVAEGPIKTIAVPCAYEDTVVRCLATIMREGIARVVFVGDKESTLAVAREENVELESAEFVEERDELAACITAAGLVRDGRAQVLMKGMVQTGPFMKAVLNKRKGLLAPGKLLSCVSVFEIPTYNKLLLLTDPAVNIGPTLEHKKQIALNAIDMAHRIGIKRPKVACVESIETVNPKMQGTVDARDLKMLGESGFWGEADVDGPFGFDVAVSSDAAATKGVGGPVAGDADIVLLPDLAAANVLYKSFVWFAGARVANVVAGVNAPIVIASRSDSEEMKFLSLALAVHVSQ